MTRSDGDLRFVLWDSIYAKRDGGAYAWDKSPWFWVYTFERVE